MYTHLQPFLFKRESMEIDTEDLTKTLAAHILLPGGIQYREQVKGPLDTKAIEANRDLLLVVRQHRSQITQSAMQHALLKLVDQNEKSWHLAEEQFDFAERNVKRIRAMLHDINQNLCKYKGKTLPHWLASFLVQTQRPPRDRSTSS